MPKILLTLPVKKKYWAGGFWGRVYPKLAELGLESGGAIGGRWIVKGQAESLDVFEGWYKWLLSEPE